MQVAAKHAAAQVRDRKLADARLSKVEKHAAQAGHRLEWGRSLTACAQCWLQPAFCPCAKFTRFDDLEDSVNGSVVGALAIHMHHREWCGKRAPLACAAAKTMEGLLGRTDARKATKTRCTHI